MTSAKHKWEECQPMWEHIALINKSIQMLLNIDTRNTNFMKANYLTSPQLCYFSPMNKEGSHHLK